MNMVGTVGIYSNEIVDFSLESHLLEKAHTYIVVLLLRRLDSYEALGKV
jgi:hypothetical protein